MTRYYSNASKAPLVKPGDIPGSIGVCDAPDNPSPIGIASEVGRIGGFDWQADRSLGPVEAVWSLAIGKEDVEGRFALRAGRFVELAEDVG
jgi:hypothetical protein